MSPIENSKDFDHSLQSADSLARMQSTISKLQQAYARKDWAETIGHVLLIEEYSHAIKLHAKSQQN